MPKATSTGGMIAAAEERSALAKSKVRAAIDSMAETGEAVTFKTVAERAGVGRKFLYDNFREEIERLRSETAHMIIEVGGQEGLVRSAGRAVAAENALRDQVARLEEELAAERRMSAILRRHKKRALEAAEKWFRLQQLGAADYLAKLKENQALREALERLKAGKRSDI